MTTLERRHSERARIPCNIPVELTDAVHSAQFEADATDLSVGGLSLRAARLPDLGSQLFCCFEAMPGGATVLGRGEVVWREPLKGSDGGEFGLRFIEIDPKNQALIDEMVAERIARIESPFGQPAELQPVLAKLEIENVADAVSARLVHTGETEALFEQALDQFSVGKAVTAHAGVSLVRGHIASVKLRMEGASPRLVLTLELPRDPSRFGEYEWGEPGSDTDPDIFDYKDKPAQQANEPLLEDSYSYETSATADADADADVDDDDDSGLDDEEDEDSDDLDDGEAGDDDYEDDGEEHVLSLSDVQFQDDDDVLPNYRRERSRTLAGLGQAAAAGQPIVPIFTHDKRGSGHAQLPLFKGDAAQSGQTLIEGQRLQLSLEGYQAPAAHQATQLGYAQHQAKEEAIMALLSNAPAAAAQVDGAPEPGVDHDERDSGPLPVYEDAANSPFVRVLRVLARIVELFRSATERSREVVERLRQSTPQGFGKGLFGNKPRRVTAQTTQPIAAPKRKKLMLIGIGALSVVGLAVVAYALIPEDGLSPGDDAGEVASAETVTDHDTAIAAPETHEPGQASGQPPAAAPNLGAAATGATNPANVNHAPDPRAAAKPAGPTTQFGQRQIRNPRRFLLRMSEPVKLLQGTAEPGGFSVVIANNHATERAVAIRAGHPAVASAQIINRRDRSAELRVRFVEGRSPAFRVTGHGSSLEVLIEQ